MTVALFKALHAPIRGREALIGLGVGSGAIVFAYLVGSLAWQLSPLIAVLLGLFAGLSSVFANWLTIWNLKLVAHSRALAIVASLWMMTESVLMLALLWTRISN